MGDRDYIRGRYSGGDDSGQGFSFRVDNKEDFVNIADGVVSIFKIAMRVIEELDPVFVIEDHF